MPLLFMVVLAGCTGAERGSGSAPATQSVAVTATPEQTEAEAAGVEIPHIHGLGFSADGQQLVVPAHDGLRIYRAGQWSKPDVPAHDYMGYTPASDGFYSSGHPYPAAGLVNPFGLIKSTDGGKTLVKLGFEGETDFHLMAVGYQNHAIYVGNPAPNSQLAPGIHYSLDDGQTWQQSALAGLTAQPIQIAVHPTEANVLALATEQGLFLSDDYGNSLAQVGEAETVTVVAFHPDGKQLLFGYQQLASYDLASKQISALSAPTLGADDGISYLAVNPTNTDELALATFAKDMYWSSDSGKTWTQIAAAGKTK